MIDWQCDSAGLKPEMVAALERVASEYFRQCAKPLRITSGRRSLRRQAELMSGMNREQLVSLYGAKGIPDYIQALCQILDRGDKLTPDNAYDVLTHRQEGYISRHLFGAAVDLDPAEMKSILLRHLLEEHGFTTLDEREFGLACVHAAWPGCPEEIVRD